MSLAVPSSGLSGATDSNDSPAYRGTRSVATAWSRGSRGLARALAGSLRLRRQHGCNAGGHVLDPAQEFLAIRPEGDEHRLRPESDRDEDPVPGLDDDPPGGRSPQSGVQDLR